MTNDKLELDRQILFYKDLLETFYAVNYPLIERNKFWLWFNEMLIGKAKCITELNEHEKTVFLTKLKEAGDSIFKQPLTNYVKE